MSRITIAHITLFISCAAQLVASDNLTTSNNFLPARAASQDITQTLLMQQPYHPDENELFTLDAYLAPFYQRSFAQSASTNLGTRLLWSGTNALNLAQSPLVGVNAGTITLAPTVTTMGAHIGFCLTSTPSEPGLFVNLTTAVGRMTMNPHLTYENVSKENEKIIKDFLSGTKIPNATTTLLNGIIDGKQSSGFSVGDVNLVIGYNVVQEKNQQFQAGVKITLATLEQALGKYALEPLFGNNHHHGLGMQLKGVTQFYEYDNHAFTFQGTASLQHLFKSTSNKTFDIITNQTAGKVGGKGSKYQLITGLAESTKLDTPVANFSTVPTESSIGLVADLAVALTYTHHNRCSATLGYNFYAQSEEKLAIAKETPINAAYLTNSTTLYKISDLDITSCQQSRIYTSKLFMACGYTSDDTLYTPYLQIMGNIEFSHVQNNAVPTWGFGIMSGLSF